MLAETPINLEKFNELCLCHLIYILLWPAYNLFLVMSLLLMNYSPGNILIFHGWYFCGLSYIKQGLSQVIRQERTE